MADEADMRNELSDLQTRADQIADEVLWKTHIHTCALMDQHAYTLIHTLLLSALILKRNIITHHITFFK